MSDPIDVRDMFTLEKLKIDERMRAVEIQLGVLTIAVQDLKDVKNSTHENLLKSITRNTLVLDGTDGQAGLIVRVDRTERTLMILAFVCAALVTAGIGELMHWLIHLH